MMHKPGFVYIMASPNRGVLYVGVTSALTNRIWQHRNKYYPNSFTAKYNCVVLVYYQYCDSITSAIAEEQRLKKGSRKQKEMLIDSLNPDWNDLWTEIFP
jgi:putative endonuclease